MIKGKQVALFGADVVQTSGQTASRTSRLAIRLALVIASFAATIGLSGAASAQQSSASSTGNQICNSNLVSGNMPRFFKDYVGTSAWMNLAGVLDHDFNERVSNVRSVGAEGNNTICRSDLSLDFPGANGANRHLDVRGLDFIVTSENGQPREMRVFHWPTADDNGTTGDAFYAKWSINGVPMLPQIKAVQAASAASPQPKNVTEAMSMMNRAAKAQAEGIARQQGYGGMIDAEAARRAKLTPNQRAAEDAYNAGPARGETICIVRDGVRRCKTGR